jgi:hypothetical protein
LSLSDACGIDAVIVAEIKEANIFIGIYSSFLKLLYDGEAAIVMDSMKPC